MKGNMEERACALAAYIIENRATVRAAALIGRQTDIAQGRIDGAIFPDLLTQIQASEGDRRQQGQLFEEGKQRRIEGHPVLQLG